MNCFAITAYMVICDPLVVGGGGHLPFWYQRVLIEVQVVIKKLWREKFGRGLLLLNEYQI